MLNDLWSIEAPKDLGWPKGGAEGLFIEVYDWDTIVLDQNSENFLQHRLVLCTGFFPCNLVIAGSKQSVLTLNESGTIDCSARNACVSVKLEAVQFICSSRPTEHGVLYIDGTSLETNGVSFTGCASLTNGGVISCFGDGSTAHIQQSTFSDIWSGGTGGAISVIGCSLNVMN